MSSYVRVLLKEFYTELKKEILENLSDNLISDSVLDKMITRPDDEGRVYYDE